LAASSDTPESVTVPVWLLLPVLGAAIWQLAVAVGSLMRALGGGWAVDYLAFQTGARLLSEDGRALYSRSAQATVQAGILGYRPISSHFPQLFVNPPLAALLLRPVAWLSLQASADVFEIILVIALALAAACAMRLLQSEPMAVRRLAALLTVVAGPAGYSLLLGQWAPLLLCVALGAALLAPRRAFLAGLLLSLLLVKPQVVWLLPPVLLPAARWRLLAGLVTGGAIIGIGSLALVGLSGLGDYIQILTNSSLSGANSLSVGQTLATVTGGRGDLIIVAALGVALALVTWRFRRPLAADPRLAIAWGLAVSICLAPHANDQDFLVLGLAALLWLPRFPRATLGLTAAVGLALMLWPFNWTSWLPGLAPVMVVVALAAVTFALTRQVASTPPPMRTPAPA
jgi:hypothetical protein